MYKILLIIAVFACAKVKLEVLVVELPAETGNTPQETIKKNIERYAKHLETIRHHIGRGVNIVVFPEYGLTGLNPNVEESAQFIPDMYQSHSGLPDNIKQLSDLAISSGVHLVVNMLEMDNSTNTKRYYNTLVVFDTYGRIIAKARKFNLTPKEKMKLTPGTSVATFTFYLYQFCLLIGEDILTLEAFNNVNTFAGVIISSSWQNTLPSNLATSIAYGYFKRTKTKVFYSNLNNPEEGISGSGLYSEEKVDAEMTGTSRTIMKYGLYFPGMLFPYNSNQHEKANEELTTLGKSERFANEDPISGLKLITQLPETVKKTPAIKNTIINDYGRCTLVTTTDLSTVYQLIAYETIERIGSRDYLSYFCGIIPTDTNLRTKTNVTLEKVTITIQPKTTEKIITLPIVADYNFLPADFSYNVSDGTVATIQDKRDIIVFGIRTLKPITIINIGTASIFVAPTKSAQQTIKTNIEKYSLRLEKSKGENWHCDLLVLPEYGLTGLNPDLEHSAQFLPDINVTPNEYQDNIKALSNLAIKYKVNLVVNLLEFEAKKYYNALVVFDKLGRLKQKTRKINLTLKEREQLSPGTEIRTVELSGLKLALLIGEDILTPEASKLEDVDGVVVSSAWGNEPEANKIADDFHKKKKIPVYLSNLFDPNERVTGPQNYFSDVIQSNYVNHEFIKSENGFIVPIKRTSIRVLPRNNVKLLGSYVCQIFTSTDVPSIYQFVMEETKRTEQKNDISYFCGLKIYNNQIIDVTLRYVKIVVYAVMDENINIRPISFDYFSQPVNYKKYFKNHSVSVEIENKSNIYAFGIRITKNG